MNEEFRHERLKLSGNFMRLLQIQGGTKKDIISLRITQYAIHRRPPYAAISYTWGPNPKHVSISRNNAASVTAVVDQYTRLIRVNGRPFRIRINLWNLLYHLRQRGESRFLWVDALCIGEFPHSPRLRTNRNVVTALDLSRFVYTNGNSQTKKTLKRETSTSNVCLGYMRNRSSHSCG